MRLGRARARELALLVTSLVLCLIFAELVMRRLHPLWVAAAPTTATGKASLYGWAPEPGQPLSFVDQETGSSIEGRANSQGWRDVEHVFAKPPGVVRILFVGDSFTYGSVPLQDLYTRRVEARLHDLGYPRVEVISIGVGGWGPDQELEALRNEGLRYGPDLVVYQFCSNDIINLDPPPALRGDMSLGRHKPFRYLVEDGVLRRIDPSTAEAARSIGRFETLHRLLRESALFRTLAKLVEGPDDPPRVPDPSTDRITSSAVVARFGIAEAEKRWSRAGWTLFEALVREMDAVSRAHGARFLVFSESGEPGLRRHLLARGDLSTEQGADYVRLGGTRLAVDMLLPLARLSAICERAGIPLIAPRRTYERFREDWHATRSANENMASDIVDFLLAWPAFRELAGAGPAAPGR
jgi:hypothetical protein